MGEEMDQSQNRATVTVGGREYEVEASNGACLTYREQFSELEGLSGRLAADVSSEAVGVVGLPCVTWADVPALLSAIWAMARAAGSTKASWAKFHAAVMDAAADPMEVKGALEAIVYDDGLMGRTFFRGIVGQGDAGEPDKEQEG